MTTTFSIGGNGEVKMNAATDYSSLEAKTLTAMSVETKNLIVDRLKGQMAADYKRDHDAAMARVFPVQTFMASLTAKREALVTAQDAVKAFVEKELKHGKSGPEAEAMGARLAGALKYAGEMNAEVTAPTENVGTAWNSYYGHGGVPTKSAPKRKGKGKGKGKKN